MLVITSHCKLCYYALYNSYNFPDIRIILANIIFNWLSTPPTLAQVDWLFGSVPFVQPRPPYR